MFAFLCVLALRSKSWLTSILTLGYTCSLRVYTHIHRANQECQLCSFQNLWERHQSITIKIPHFYGIKDVLCHRQEFGLETGNEG